MSPQDQKQENPGAQEARCLYEVTATLMSQEARDRYLGWLRAGHAAALLSWALRAEVSALNPSESSDPSEPQAWRVKSSYVFQDREAYERYVREGAPALRAEGLALAAQLEPLGGVSFTRSLSDVWSC